MKIKWISRLAVACLSGIANPVCASDISISSQDGRFIRNYSEIILEVESLARLAQTQAQDAQLRQVAAQLARDYSIVGHELAADAQAAGMSTTPQLSAKATQTINGLAIRSGVEFDDAALRLLFDAQVYGAHELELESRGGGNPSWRQWAAMLQAGLQADLRNTQQLDALFNGHT